MIKLAKTTLLTLLSLQAIAKTDLCSPAQSNSFKESLELIRVAILQNFPFVGSCEELAPHLNHIEYINLGQTREQIENIEPLLYFKNLKYLDLSYQDNIQNIEQIGKLKKLVYLRMQHVFINDLSWIKNLPQLEEFSFRPGPNLNNLTPLNSLTNLKNLDIRNGVLVSTSFLPLLKKLVNLTLINTGLDTINGPLSVYINSIDVSYNSLKNFESLTNLTAMAYLSARNNQINDLSHLAKLPQLKYFDLKNNLIEDISPLVELNLDDLIFNYSGSQPLFEGNPIETNPFNEKFCPTKSKSRGVNWYCINKMLQQRQP